MGVQGVLEDGNAARITNAHYVDGQGVPYDCARFEGLSAFYLVWQQGLLSWVCPPLFIAVNAMTLDD